MCNVQTFVYDNSHNDKFILFIYLTELCNSRFKSSLELMLRVIDISTLNKTYLIFECQK
jgi:hypothetical protein